MNENRVHAHIERKFFKKVVNASIIFFLSIMCCANEHAGLRSESSNRFFDGCNQSCRVSRDSVAD